MTLSRYLVEVYTLLGGDNVKQFAGNEQLMGAVVLQINRLKDRRPTDAGLRVWAAQPIKKLADNAVNDGVENALTVEHFTCCNCPCVVTCDYAYDLYNLDGDCLAVKEEK